MLGEDDFLLDDELASRAELEFQPIKGKHIGRGMDQVVCCGIFFLAM